MCRFFLLALLLIISPLTIAQQGGRPAGLTVSNFQFGPQNRWSYSHIREVIPTVNIPHDRNNVLPLARHTDYHDRLEIKFQGSVQDISKIAEHQYIDGIIIVKDGKILFEKYFSELRPELTHLMMSETKSVIGLLAGIFEAKGLIDLNKTVGYYVPALANSGWGPDSLRTVLDMKDGADYTEDYEDFTSTVRLQDCALGWTRADYCPENGPRGGYEFFATVGRNEANSGRFVYKSGSTDVMGWVLEEAGKAPLAELISTHIWQPMGAGSDASITVDESGFVLGDGGMNATLRDMARLGLLMLNKGKAGDVQVVPSAFIDDIFDQARDENWPYPPDHPDDAPYYRSFWWGTGNSGRDVSAVGIHGQLLHVAPAANIAVAIFSTWPGASGDDKTHGWSAISELSSGLVEIFRD